MLKLCIPRFEFKKIIPAVVALILFIRVIAGAFQAWFLDGCCTALKPFASHVLPQEKRNNRLDTVLLVKSTENINFMNLPQVNIAKIQE